MQHSPVVATLAFLLAACAPVHVPHVASDCRPSTRVFHGDVGFTAPERSDIESAAVGINESSGGASSVVVIWDLDMARIPAGNLLLRVPELAPQVLAADRRFGARVLGWWSADLGHLVLIPERIVGRVQAVATHEMLHSLGLPHSNGTMAPIYSRAYERVDQGAAIALCGKEGSVE